MFHGTGVVDGAAVLTHPLADSVQTLHSLGLYQSLRRGPHTEYQRAALSHNLDEQIDDFLRRFPAGTRHPTPVVAQRDATFPWEIQLCFRHGALLCLIVLVGSVDGSVYHEQAGLMASGHFCDGGHVDVLLVLLANPSAVHPENVYRAIARQDFLHLSVGVFLELLPSPGPFLCGIGGVATAVGIDIPPVVLRVPVRLREVGAYHEVLLAEGFQHVFQHIALRIVAEGVLGNGEVGLLRVEHTETVVVFRGEDHVLHACIFHRIGPLLGVELRGIELVGQSPVPVFILVEGARGVLRNPVFVADGPRLHDARHAVDAPVHQHSELQVLPLVEFLQHQLIGWPHVSLRPLVHISLCPSASRQRQGCQHHHDLLLHIFYLFIVNQSFLCKDPQWGTPSPSSSPRYLLVE